MLNVVPTSASPQGKGELHALLASAKATADALAPHLRCRESSGEEEVVYSIVKVVSCKAFYSALLRSDGTLLLLSHSNVSESPSPSSAECAARVTVLESGGEPVRDVAAGATHIVYCTVSGAVFSCGYDNTYGQLGDGTVWTSPWSSQGHGDGSAAVRSSAGRFVAPLLSTPKRLSGFGEAGFIAASARGGEAAPPLTSTADCLQALGLASTDAPGAATALFSKRLPPPQDRCIAQVACGTVHTLLLTNVRRCVYACGCGERGELGGARAVLVQPSFRSIPLLFGLPIRQIAAAEAHSFALLDNGLLYAFGDNTCGQLGLGDTKRVRQPTLVPLSGQELPSKERAGSNPPHTSRLPLDAKAHASLRAAYDSAESVYYPLRVPRLQADAPGPHDGTGAGHTVEASTPSSFLDAGATDAVVRRVHCCGSWTLLETDRPGVWLSCGAGLTRGVATLSPPQTEAAMSADGADGEPSRIDGCGVLGRPLLHSKSEAYRFAPVHWASALAGERGEWEMAVTPPAWTHDEASQLSPSHGSVSRMTVAEGATKAVPTPRVAANGRGGGEDSVYAPNSPSLANTTAVHRSSSFRPRRRTSETVASLCHTKKTVKGVEKETGMRVCAYPTSLQVFTANAASRKASSADAEQTPNGTEGTVMSRLLVQSGSSVAIAVEVDAADASKWRVVRGSAADASEETTSSAAEPDALHRSSCGASVLELQSAHGLFIPLPSYALVM